MTCDAKFIACLEKFSSKFNYPMIKNFGIVNPVFQQAEITELLRSKMKNFSFFRVAYISLIFY